MTYRFGVFEFDDRAAVLTRSDRAVALEPQPARALGFLLSRAGDVVTREELRAHLWGGETHVDFDRGLAYCIGQLRTALGDSADNPRFIQTHPRRGFSFIAPTAMVEPDRSTFDVLRSSFDGTENGLAGTKNEERRTENDASATFVASATVDDRSAKAFADLARRSGEAATASRSVSAALVVVTAAVFLVVAVAGWWSVSRNGTPERPIVAVAVFDNETGDASRERAVATIADVVVERLTALGPARIGVNGNSKVLRNPRADRDPRTVARETHASFLIAGHLQTKDGRLSLLMHIIRLDDGTHVWVHRISRSADDRLESLDEDVAAQIEKAVRRIVLKDDIQVS
jgi:DNA-binding winged helix-turn-helix (wHTH) protein/TolB-like protein